MQAEIISVGTELLLGEIVDTNAAWLAQQLVPLGVNLYWISTVGDNQARLVEVLRRALGRSDLIIVTGGLGPTEDDVTREAIAEALGEEMVVQPALAEQLRCFFQRRGYPMPEHNLKQATLIPSAQALDNPIGTAPGWWVEHQGHVIITMPGVPSEMKRMWREQALPRLQTRLGDAIIVTRTFKTIGIGESRAEELVSHLIHSHNPTLATYAKSDGVHLRAAAKAPTEAAARAMLANLETQVRAAIGSYIYGVDDETLEGVVGRLLRERNLTLATMESCTGGLLANIITDAPGSSAYFRGGLVAYTPELKARWGVDPALIAEHGVVSPQVAAAMATAARRETGADVGLGITGVAGPDPLEGHPPGTLHLGLDLRGQVETISGVYGAERRQIKRLAALNALGFLRRRLLERDDVPPAAVNKGF